MPKNISLNVEESLFPKVSLLEQLSCPFVLIARKEFLCFNYKKIPGKNFFCPSRRFVHCNKSGGSVSAVMGLLQQSKSKSILLSAWADTETSLSTVNTTVLCPSTSWHWNITMHGKLLHCSGSCSSSRGGASDGFISFPLFWNERCHGSHLAHSTLH